MFEIVQYIFSSFWRWVGMLIYLIVIFGSIGSMTWIKINRNK